MSESAGSAEHRTADIDVFAALLQQNPGKAELALKIIEENWEPGYAIMMLELARATRERARATQILAVLNRATGQDFGADAELWYRWIWNQPSEPHPKYGEFKAKLFSLIDRQFGAYFRKTDSATIRLDEIRWGGVKRDGIPPLKNPDMIPASEADYLDDSHVVFGVKIGDDARAFPKRILAWHEMFKATIGGESVCGVYCTLCGSLIVYSTVVQDQHHELGTSGFLYRSNKLMYDHATESLWSTLDGQPVVGPLVGQGIQLASLNVVTTTWGEWRERHPQTTVMSLDTGYERDYGEGIAYKDYFATDELMFGVPNPDDRLANKADVFVVRPNVDVAQDPLAIASEFLRQQRVYHNQIGGKKFVVLTDASGAHRAYEAKDHQFDKFDSQQLMDKSGNPWSVSESALTSDSGAVLQRLPAHRAFWFGWVAQFPKSRLVK